MPADGAVEVLSAFLGGTIEAIPNNLNNLGNLDAYFDDILIVILNYIESNNDSSIVDVSIDVMSSILNGLNDKKLDMLKERFNSNNISIVLRSLLKIEGLAANRKD